MIMDVEQLRVGSFAVVSSLCFWSLWCVRMQQQLPFSLSLSLSLCGLGE